MPRMKKCQTGQNRRSSRVVRGVLRCSPDRRVGGDYTYDLNGAGKDMSPWAQAQQLVKLIRGLYTISVTIPNELPLKYESSSNAAPGNRNRLSQKTRKTVAPLLTATGSFEVVEALQKSVETVIPPPDAQQEAYVCDEEDLEMLKLVADKKMHLENSRLTIPCFEETITLLERESMKFRGTNSSFTLPVDEDAVCSVCQKGDCDNTNLILFCDMCNLAVHQDCYGVPNVPDGQWHCRRCMVSTASTVQCIFCPNSEGALKQTDDSRWAHVICAIYIPPVMFGSTQLLEPVINIEGIAPSMYNLTCCVCKQQTDFDKDKKVGVCIQCKEPGCEVAFHVTCAQKAGYHMVLKAADDDEKDLDDASSEESDGEPIAFCGEHSRFQLQEKHVQSSLFPSNSLAVTNKSQQQQLWVESLNIDSDNLIQIAKEVKLDKNPKLFILILNYWKSKRRYRNGLPLLRRPIKRIDVSSRMESHEDLEAHRCMFESIRQHVEQLRTITEYQLLQDMTELARDEILDVRIGFELMPANNVLKHVFDRIKAADKDYHFAQPATGKIERESVSMDFSTMAKKLEVPCAYSSFEEFQADVNLVIVNCLQYNQRDTILHEYASTFRAAVEPMLQDGRRDYEEYAGRARDGTSVCLKPGVFDHDDCVASKRSAIVDDIPSVVSTADDEFDGRDYTNAELNDGGASLVQEDYIASTRSVLVTCSRPIVRCRLIPCRPKLGKNPHPSDIPANVTDYSSKEEQYDSARKRARLTSRSFDNPPSIPVPTMARKYLQPYDTGRRLNNIASLSELGDVLASKDSNDSPSGDCEFDSESQPQRPLDLTSERLTSERLTSERLASSHLPCQRQRGDYRVGDMVWAKVENLLNLPGFIADPMAVGHLQVKEGVFIIPWPPGNMQIPHRFPYGRKEDDDVQSLVYFRQSLLKWAWVPHCYLDFLLIDDEKDRQRLNESSDPGEKAVIQSSYDFAKYLASVIS